MRPAVALPLLMVLLPISGSSAQIMSADVVVIGAGFAGLKAAADLKAKGLSVIVLEGRNRVGGRAWSESMTAGGKTVYAELGAAWIHGVTGNPMTTLATSAAVALSVKTNYNNNALFYASGKRATDAEETRIDGFYDGFEYPALTNAQKAARSAYTTNPATDPGLSSATAAYIKAEGLTGADLTGFNYSVNVNIEQEYGAAVNQLSLFFDGDLELSGGDKFVLGGYQNMAAFLAKTVDVRLSTVVKQINATSAASIKVTTTAGQVFTTSRVVVAVPLGVLQRKSISFLPALNATQQASIDKLGMGLLNKVVLGFSKVFWTSGVEVLNRIPPNNDGAWAETVAFNIPTGGAPVLVAFNAATYARALEAKNDQQTVDEVMAVLRTLYPGAPSPTSFKVTRWASDPLACGSYSYLAKGASPADRRSAAAAVGGRIFFAGEHTRNDYPATTHGAFLSGKTAACDVLVSFKRVC